MSLINIKNAYLNLGGIDLLDNCSFQLDSNEKLGLIGRNGSGKSSLLRVISGQQTLDEGDIQYSSGLKIAYVPQEADFSSEQTVFDAVLAGLGKVAEDLHRYQHIIEQLASSPHDQSLLEEMTFLQHAIDEHGGWVLNNKVNEVLLKLNLDGKKEVAQLSGGGVKRVALARALVSDPQLLLLDEPTNHLDIDGVLWLESLLTNFAGAVLLITHDREFLDHVVTRIVELDRGKINTFPGSFSSYLERKEHMLATEEKSANEFDKFLAQEEVWIRKGIEARRTRNEGRVRRLEALRIERAARRERLGKAKITLDSGEKSGQLVVELKDICKSYGEHPIIAHYSTRIMRKDKVGLIGPNGIGKTTLLKILLGDLAVDSGEVVLGTKQQVAYFDQFRMQLDPEKTLVEVISPGSDYLMIAGVRKHVIGYLGDFLFTPERARTKVKSLSGGERNRLLLARLFSQPANILVMDEPTNDLDIETLELLENLLSQYDGTLFLVSHDRAFLDNVVTQVIVGEGNGIWKDYVGGYRDWQQSLKSSQAKNDEQKKNTALKKTTDIEKVIKAQAQQKKLNSKERSELEKLPDYIETLESEQTAINLRLSDASLYQNQAGVAQNLTGRSAELTGLIEKAMARWEELANRDSE